MSARRTPTTWWPGRLDGPLVREVREGKLTATTIFKVDVGLLRELREIEEQAARELGQRKQELGSQHHITIDMAERLAAGRPRCCRIAHRYPHAERDRGASDRSRIQPAISG